MRLHLLAAVTLMAATASAAQADGLPVGNLDTTRTGVAVPGSAARYFAIPAGRGTLVTAVTRSGRLQAYANLPGPFTIPAVAQDGTTSGLSANDATLVLVRPRLTYPQRVTRLAVLDAPSLRTTRTIALRGDFSIDAIAPDGLRLYLIQYTSPGDPFAYAVRSLNLASGRLERGEIVDPRERDEAMHGLPVTRAMSPDGRWAYTLYDGGANGPPFIHALDTGARRARCVDLPPLPAGVDINTLRLTLHGGQLGVGSATRAFAVVDRRTFAVSKPPAAGHAATGPDGAGDSFPWGLAAAVAAIGGLALLVLRRRYAAGTDSAASRSASSSSPTVP